MMARTLCLLLALLAAPAVAGEPKAVLRGPQSAAADQEFWLKLSGTVSEGQVDLELAGGPSPVEPVFLFSKDGIPVYAVAAASQPGTYTFVLVAHGTDAAGKARRSYAFWPVTVTLGAAPAPGPSPGPAPEPPPAPTPTPIDAVKGKLWAVMILPATPDPVMSAARTDPGLRAAMSSRDVTFRSYLANEAEVSDPLWTAALSKAGGPPAVVWMTADSKFLRATRAPDAASVLSALKQIRGEP